MGRLSAYRTKRDFRVTSEPDGDDDRPTTDRPRFVIQQHDASSMHWDLRLEEDGVLVSWAVPKGPSTDPREKRLARHVEDHPVDYVTFEGVIPQGEYGAGSVIVWDAGTYRNLTSRDDVRVSLHDAVADGHLSVELHGEKLTGPFALTRFRGEDDWLLVKMPGEGADARRRPTSTQPRSVLTGRTIDEVADEDAEAGER